MNPRRGLGLAHAAHASMPQWRGMLLEVDQNAQEPSLRGWEGAVLIGCLASRLPTPPMQGPCGHVVQECGLTRGSQGRTLLHGQARQIQDLGGMGGEIAIS
jgi:hypothetical protein